MTCNLLILGGTSEANQLATEVAKLGINAIYSYAGRVDTPRDQPIPTRIGGFGGVEGLSDYLRDKAITHLIDATHPFAAQISCNAIAASERTGVPYAGLLRPPWPSEPKWQHVPDVEAAVSALATPKKRVFLAIGRTEAERFLAQPQHHYILRYVDIPDKVPTFPDHLLFVDRGPFSFERERHLFDNHRIDLVVSKNSGGKGARAKLEAARQKNVPVLMIDRPILPARRTFETVEDTLDWVHHTDLGV